MSNLGFVIRVREYPRNIKTGEAILTSPVLSFIDSKCFCVWQLLSVCPQAGSGTRPTDSAHPASFGRPASSRSL